MRARNFVGCVRARGLPARQPARLLISRALWLLNARPVAKTDALIVFLSEFWVYEGRAARRWEQKISFLSLRL